MVYSAENIPFLDPDVILRLKFFKWYNHDACSVSIYIQPISKNRLLKQDTIKCLASGFSEEYRIGLLDLYIKLLSKFLFKSTDCKNNQTNGIIKSKIQRKKVIVAVCKTSMSSKILFIPII